MLTVGTWLGIRRQLWRAADVLLMLGMHDLR